MGGKYFLSANGVYEVCTEDYALEHNVEDSVWQSFADRLGEAFGEVDDDLFYSDYWNVLHERVCSEFSQIFN